MKDKEFKKINIILIIVLTFTSFMTIIAIQFIGVLLFGISMWFYILLNEYSERLKRKKK